MYRLGQLNKVIVIERDMRYPDGLGGHTLEPVAIAKAWALLRNKSARELLQGQQLQSTGTCIFVIRNRADLLPSDRIIFGGVKYNIRGIPPYNSRDAFIEIDAERGVAN